MLVLQLYEGLISKEAGKASAPSADARQPGANVPAPSPGSMRASSVPGGPSEMDSEALQLYSGCVGGPRGSAGRAESAS